MGSLEQARAHGKEVGRGRSVPVICLPPKTSCHSLSRFVAAPVPPMAGVVTRVACSVEGGVSVAFGRDEIWRTREA